MFIEVLVAMMENGEGLPPTTPPAIERPVQGPKEHFDLEDPLSRNRFGIPIEPPLDLNRNDRFDLEIETEPETPTNTDFQCSLRPNKKFVRCVRRR